MGSAVLCDSLGVGGLELPLEAPGIPVVVCRISFAFRHGPFQLDTSLLPFISWRAMGRIIRSSIWGIGQDVTIEGKYSGL